MDFVCNLLLFLSPTSRGKADNKPKDGNRPPRTSQSSSPKMTLRYPCLLTSLCKPIQLNSRPRLNHLSYQQWLCCFHKVISNEVHQSLGLYTSDLQLRHYLPVWPQQYSRPYRQSSWPINSDFSNCLSTGGQTKCRQKYFFHVSINLDCKSKMFH